LTKLGFTNPVTGVFSAATRSAVLLCQKKFKMELTGVADNNFQERLPASVTSATASAHLQPAQVTVQAKADVKSIPVSVSSEQLDPLPRDSGIVVVAVLGREAIQDTINELGELISARWAFIVVCKDDLLKKPEGPMAIFRSLKAKSDNIHDQWDQALAAVRYISHEFPMVMVLNGVGSTKYRSIQLVPVLLSGEAQVAIGSWFSPALDKPMSVGHGAVMDGLVDPAVTLFRASLLGREGPVLDPGLGENIFRDLFLRWKLAKVRFVTIPGPVVFRGELPQVPGSWAVARDKVIRGLWDKPKVSALLLTGRCLNRYYLASVAVQCFFDQTWPNKELVIINHGERSLLDNLNPAQCHAVREVKMKRPEGMTIGDLRNLSMDNATGDWLIQWDDDDWHHPLRMETQMEHAAKETVVTFNWQVRCNLLTGAAFYDKMEGGQHMSVCYPKTTHRYEKLNVREDTAFFQSFSKVVTIDNGPDEAPVDPFMYVLFYHGMNIWDRRHIMGGSTQTHKDDDASVELSSYHTGMLKGILACYERTGARVPL